MDTIYLKKIRDLTEIPILVWNEQDGIQFTTDEGLHCHLAVDRNFKESIPKIAKDKNCPFFYLEDSQIYYGIMKTQEEYLCFGPVCRNPLKREHLEIYKHQHVISGTINMKDISVTRMAKLLVFVFYNLTGTECDYHEVTYITSQDNVDFWCVEEDIEDYAITYSDNDKSHASMEYENLICRIVREGDMDALMTAFSEDAFDVEKNGGDVAKNTSKKMEYYVITLIILISRAAIEGGLRPEVSLTLSDIYMRKVEACKSEGELMMIGAKAQVEFTRRVQEARAERSKYVYIEECKDYIAKNLRKPMKVGDIAPAIGVNRSYLTRKFSEIEGISIQNYIVRERCSHAANLLKYSDYPISIISEYFCFSSQSHFGKQFKEIYGMTPNEYRSKNKYIVTKE